MLKLKNLLQRRVWKTRHTVKEIELMIFPVHHVFTIFHFDLLACQRLFAKSVYSTVPMLSNNWFRQIVFDNIIYYFSLEM